MASAAILVGNTEYRSLDTLACCHDDATRLDGLRKTLEELQSANINQTNVAQQVAPAPITLLERLRAADAKVVTPEIMADFVGNFFDSLIEKISTIEFSEFFDLNVTEHADFEENTTEKFIIQMLSNEKRPDNFVTAIHSRELRATSRVDFVGAIVASSRECKDCLP
jgi:hypothetical protein